MNAELEILNIPEEAEMIERILTALIFNDKNLLKPAEVSDQDENGRVSE